MQRYPEYSSLKKRIESFRSFPIKGITSTEFAEAGFFSIGVQDYTRCFHCGVGLRGWNDTDDPWKQHAKFSTLCQYLLEKKGKSFVKLQTNSNPTHFDLKKKDQRESQVESKKDLTEEEIKLQVQAKMDTNAIQMVLKYKEKLGLDDESLRKAIENDLRLKRDNSSRIEDLIEESNKIYNNVNH